VAEGKDQSIGIVVERLPPIKHSNAFFRLFTTISGGYSKQKNTHMLALRIKKVLPTSFSV
jgi:hypothetical protein